MKSTFRVLHGEKDCIQCEYEAPQSEAEFVEALQDMVTKWQQDTESDAPADAKVRGVPMQITGNADFYLMDVFALNTPFQAEDVARLEAAGIRGLKMKQVYVDLETDVPMDPCLLKANKA